MYRLIPQYTYLNQPFICEDSEQLLEFMRSSEPDEDIPDPPEDDEEEEEEVDDSEVRRFRRRPF